MSTSAELVTTSNHVDLRPLLVDAKQAARLLGIGRTKLYELMDVGAITPVHIGRCVRFPVAELERFVADGCHVDGDPPSPPSQPPVKRRSPRRTAPRSTSLRLFDPSA